MGLFVRKVKTSSGATAVQIKQDRIDAGQLAFDLDALTPGSPVTAAPTVVGSSSRVLCKGLEDAYARLGLGTVDDGVFRKPVLAWVGSTITPRNATDETTTP